MSKRSRSANFSPAENKIFKRITEKYKHILDNSATDSKTNEKKRFAWLHLTKVFNRISPSGIHRDTEQLRNKFQNMRKLERQALQEKSTEPGTATADNMGSISVANTSDSLDESMDPLDFEIDDDTNDTDDTAVSIFNHKANTTQNVTANVDASMTNDNVLNLLENFVASLRQKCADAAISSRTPASHTVSASDPFGFPIASQFKILFVFLFQNVRMSAHAQLQSEHIKIEQTLNGGSLNDDDHDDTDSSDDETLKNSTLNGAKRTRAATSDLKALKRKLVERKILLCNLQIDIARKQLEALDKPPTTNS